MVEKIAEEKQSSSYKLIDLLKFVCAFLVIGIHTRPFQASSELLDKVFYYDISNYAVPFFYACTGYFLVLNHPEETLQTKSMSSCIKILKIYLLWSAVYLPLTVCGWFLMTVPDYDIWHFACGIMLWLAKTFTHGPCGT